MAAFALRRATRDIDLLALRTDNDPAVVEQLIAEVAGLFVGDGVVFLLDTVTTRLIREDDFYPGVRVALDARVATAQIKFSVDLNVGDPVVPAPIRTAVPTLLGPQLARSDATALGPKLSPICASLLQPQVLPASPLDQSPSP